MGNFFADIYRFFKNRKGLLYILLILSFIVMGYLSLQIKLNEDLLSFIPNSDKKQTSLIFNNIGSNDKIFIMVSGNKGSCDPDSLIDIAQSICNRLKESHTSNNIKEITSTVGQESILAVTDFIYNNLPIFLTEADYNALEKKITQEGIEQAVAGCYNNLISPQGMLLKDIMLRDPLGIAGEMLAQSLKFAGEASYATYSDHIFSQDMSTLLITVTPKAGISETAANEPLVNEIEKVCKEYGALCYGGPVLPVQNAQSIKSDTALTLTIAAIIIVLVMTLAFRNKFAVVLVTIPVAFGGLFSLSIIYLIKGSISTIAIGTGTAVFGIAISYAIHVIAHQNHTNSPYEIIKELAYPLTIGSITTIGAFLGLLLTDSSLLHDFGLFAALALIGTTIFCLIFLPHLLGNRVSGESPLLKFIDKATGYEYHKNRWVTGSIFVIAIISLFWYNKVGFNSNMSDLSITPAHTKAAEERLAEIFPSKKTTIFIANHNDPDSAAIVNANLSAKLEKIKGEGGIEEYTPLDRFIIPQHIQKERIEKWHMFWESHSKAKILDNIKRAGILAGFTPDAFGAFEELLNKEYTQLSPDSREMREMPLLKEIYSTDANSLTVIVNRVTVDPQKRAGVYAQFENDNNVIIADRSFYTNAMAESVKNDFNTALLISSLLIFIALLVSYGRIELALLAFAPMAVAWVIILGLMAVTGREFNVINIILSTFIFGIGDDFSIFIMDGLLKEYKTGEKILPAHKTAIFFSAFATVVGVGSLIFAEHLALSSIATISIIGMSAVVIVSFTIQPLLFNLFIKKPAKSGGFPYTFCGILNTIYAFAYFLAICIIMQVLVIVLLVTPYKKESKKRFFHKVLSRVCRVFMHTMFTAKVKSINETGEDFSKPAVIIANHQSFIDILQILALCDKCIMVTNGWVWHSPFFGWVIRYAGFYHINDGYEELAKAIAPAVAQGYSVAIFPEGTRSADNKVHKFRKGAFYLAEIMQLDILPIVLYGNGHISSKNQPFYIKKGTVVSRILPRIAPGTAPYKEMAGRCRSLIEKEYEALYTMMAGGNDEHFHNSLVMNYIYCGPVLEWYVKIKVKMERNYALLHSLVPHKCKVVDIGCGYGMAPFMLTLLSPQRDITGIDYDKEKIDTARNSMLMRDSGGKIKGNLKFFHANALEFDMPAADVFIMSDMLHYLAENEQITIIEKCIANLNEGGKIIIRDGDTNKKEQQKVTALSEFFSTRFTRFNKAESGLHFTSGNFIDQIAARNGMKVESISNDTLTSNTIHILTHAT